MKELVAGPEARKKGVDDFGSDRRVPEMILNSSPLPVGFLTGDERDEMFALISMNPMAKAWLGALIFFL